VLFRFRQGSTDTELVTGADDHAVLEDDLYHLLTMNRVALLVLQRGHDRLGLHLDHFARGGVGVPAVEAKRDPAGLFADRQAGDLFGRVLRRVEDMDAGVVGVGDPDFRLVGCQANAVAGAAVPLHRPRRVPLDLDAPELLAGRQVTDL